MTAGAVTGPLLCLSLGNVCVCVFVLLLGDERFRSESSGTKL